MLLRNRVVSNPSPSKFPFTGSEIESVFVSHESGSMFSIKSKAAISMSFLKKFAAFAGKIILKSGIRTIS